MTFVLDSSLAMAFVLRDEASAATDAVLDRLGQGAKAFVPALWRWEVANVLLMAERRGRIASADAHRHMLRLETFPLKWTRPHGTRRGARRTCWRKSTV